MKRPLSHYLLESQLLYSYPSIHLIFSFRLQITPQVDKKFQQLHNSSLVVKPKWKLLFLPFLLFLLLFHNNKFCDNLNEIKWQVGEWRGRWMRKEMICVHIYAYILFYSLPSLDSLSHLSSSASYPPVPVPLLTIINYKGSIPFSSSLYIFGLHFTSLLLLFFPFLSHSLPKFSPPISFRVHFQRKILGRWWWHGGGGPDVSYWFETSQASVDFTCKALRWV